MSTTFDLQYDLQGELVEVGTVYGVAEGLTEHALRHVDLHPGGTYHVCCRFYRWVWRLYSTDSP